MIQLIIVIKNWKKKYIMLKKLSANVLAAIFCGVTVSIRRDKILQTKWRQILIELHTFIIIL